MEIKTRRMARDGWSRIIEREYSHAPFLCGKYSGELGVILFKRVERPLDVMLAGNSIRIVDDGYYWLQIAPRNENFWITVAFDHKKRPVQYYVDVTLENIIDGGESYFRDLFLDVVFAPNGVPYLFDEDELDEALRCGIITKEQHTFSHSVAANIMSAFPEKINELEEFSLTALRQLSE